MEPATPESRWGLSIDDYLAVIEDYFPQRKPSLEQIENSLYMFSRVDNLTCQELEDVLLLSRYPEKMLQLTRLPGVTAPNAWDVLMIDHVLRHMKTYTMYSGQHNEIFDYYFVFLCVQPAVDPEAYFYGPLSKAIVSSFIEAGGKCSQHFSWVDTQFLNNVFAESRKSVFRICRQVPGIHGWETLFALMWLYTRSNPTDDNDMTVIRIGEIYDLVCRHALAMYGKQGHLVALTNYIVQGIKKDVENRDNYFSSLIIAYFPDLQDSEIYDLQDALIDLLNQSGANRIDGQALGIFFVFISHYQLRSTSLHGPRAELIYTTVFDRLWEEIADERCLLDMGFREKALTLVDCVFTGLLVSLVVTPSVDKEIPTEWALQVQVFVLKLLSNTDWINLAGRAVLLTTLPTNGSQSSEKDLELLARLRTILHHLNEFGVFFTKECDARIIEMFRRGPHTYDRDWDQVYKFVQQASMMQSSPVASNFAGIRRVWQGFGKALGLSNCQTDRCAYAGCKSWASQRVASMQLCGGCLKNQYCCSEC